ncbi:hypothetical protein GCM10027185_57540 [Spirosoma pulveris]
MAEGDKEVDEEDVDCAEADSDATVRPASSKKCFMKAKKNLNANLLKNSTKTLRNPFF